MKFWERLGIGIMLLWGLFALHQLVNALFQAHHWKGMSAGDWGTWIGSIGTVGALCGTIWLATEERRRREREAKDLATLAAASILLKLAHTIGLVMRVIQTFEAEPLQANNVGICARAMAENELWTDEELLPLLTLPNHIAAKLTLVRRILLTIQRRCEDAHKHALFLDPTTVSALIQQSRIALRALEEGAKECRRWAQVLESGFVV